MVAKKWDKLMLEDSAILHLAHYDLLPLTHNDIHQNLPEAAEAD